MDVLLKKLEVALDEINNEYGQDHAVRIYDKSLDYDDFHFEFGSIFGVAIFKRASDGQYMFVIINEDDDFWFIPKHISTVHSNWLKSLEDVVKRANRYVKTMNALGK